METENSRKWNTAQPLKTASKAVVGAYMTEKTHKTTTCRASNTTQRSKRTDEPKPDDNTASAQCEAILETPIREPLNGWGGHAGPRVRPSLWKVHQGMPSHKGVSTRAGTSKAVRSQRKKMAVRHCGNALVVCKGGHYRRRSLSQCERRQALGAGRHRRSRPHSGISRARCSGSPCTQT
jgi:hypothetical protein